MSSLLRQSQQPFVRRRALRRSRLDPMDNFGYGESSDNLRACLCARCA
jgi:hypothetical protein